MKGESAKTGKILLQVKFFVHKVYEIDNCETSWESFLFIMRDSNILKICHSEIKNIVKIR